MGSVTIDTRNVIYCRPKLVNSLTLLALGHKSRAIVPCDMLIEPSFENTFALITLLSDVQGHWRRNEIMHRAFENENEKPFHSSHCKEHLTQTSVRHEKLKVCQAAIL